MLRYYLFLAFHGLRRTPWLSSLLIFTLAIGVSASMTAATLRFALSRNPIPAKSTRLLNPQDSTVPGHLGGVLSYAEARSMERAVAGLAEATITAEGFGESISVPGEDKTIRDNSPGVRYATSDFFRMFDVQLQRGRLWSPAEETSAAPVALISQDLADFLFSGGHALGEQIRLGQTLYTVIGVTAPWNPKPRYYNLGSPAGAFGGGGPGLFIPVTAIQYAPNDMLFQEACRTGAPPVPSALLASECRWLDVWYLVHSPGDAPLLSKTLESQSTQLLPAERARNMQVLNVQQLLARADLVPGSVKLYATLGFFFLALCLVNAAGMQLSRVLRSQSKIGIRRALGASRTEIVKQYMCDSLLLGCSGGIFGVILTFAGLHAVREYANLMYADMAHMNKEMFVAMIVMVLASSILVGVVPAWIASRADPASVIRSNP